MGFIFMLQCIMKKTQKDSNISAFFNVFTVLPENSCFVHQRIGVGNRNRGWCATANDTWHLTHILCLQTYNGVHQKHQWITHAKLLRNAVNAVERRRSDFWKLTLDFLAFGFFLFLFSFAILTLKNERFTIISNLFPNHGIKRLEFLAHF